jgi:ferredoxin
LSEDELPDDQIEFIEINARLSEVYENITEAKEPLPEAKKFETVSNKRDLLNL